MSLKMICGSLFDSDVKYIAHQCNCLTTYGAGLAKTMFQLYPYADIYKTREPCTNYKLSRDRPGTIIVKGDGESNRFVINMLAQIFPGRPRFPDGIDSGEMRLKYFRKCLIEILGIPDLHSIGFPYKIGCNLAGGDWDKYEKMLDGFSSHVKGDVFVFKPEDGV